MHGACTQRWRYQLRWKLEALDGQARDREALDGEALDGETLARKTLDGEAQRATPKRSTVKRATAKRSTAKRAASKATSRSSKTTSARARKTSGTVKRSAAASKRSTASRKRTTASPSTASSRASGQATGGETTKEGLIESISTHLRKLKREELASLNERLDAGTLRFTDLTLSGEGGFGFQEEVRGDSGSGSDSGNKDDDESLVNRGADAGRGLLDRAKSVIGG